MGRRRLPEDLTAYRWWPPATWLHPIRPGEFLVNETFLKRLGITDPQQALNKEVDLWGQMKFNIVGVVKDFNVVSLRRALVPVLIHIGWDFLWCGRHQTAGQDIPATMKKVETIWNEVYPDYVCEARYLDAKIASFYTQERKMSYLYKIFRRPRHLPGAASGCTGLPRYGPTESERSGYPEECWALRLIISLFLFFQRSSLTLIGILSLVATNAGIISCNRWLRDFAKPPEIAWWSSPCQGSNCPTHRPAHHQLSIIRLPSPTR